MPIRFVRALFFVFVLCISAPLISTPLMAEVGVMVTIAPPPIPIYEQPVCPDDGYLWTPGYWAWDDGFDDYYWVPGTWILAPEVGFLWTPPYWAWNVDRFVFYDGYWGPTVGFYGGINYGFGYFGVGFEGGRWDNGHFFYNRAVLNVNVTEIHNVYNTRVNANNNHVSFNGGNGGVNARPTAQEEAAAHERHIPAVAAQTQHIQEAHANPQLRASENKGKPPIAATARPGDFKTGVVETREAGGAYNPPAHRGGNQPGAENRADNNVARPTTPGHVRDLPPAERPAAPNTGDAKLDKKYQQQQNKQYAQQQKERQKLAKQQEKEDQAATKQNDQAKKQQVEQQHQQQTQQLQQRHQQQQQEMQQRIQSASRPRPPR